MTSTSKTALVSRRRILDLIRGTSGHSHADNTGQPTRAFALQRHHVASLQPKMHQQYDNPLSPTDFHSILCDRIVSAQRRVLLASLYVGPAVDTQVYAQEARLLESLTTATRQNPNLDVKILLDKSRGMRPVPVKNTKTGKESTITSAEAVRRALLAHASDDDKKDDSSSLAHHQQHPHIYLHSVLSPFWQAILPNPLDEVAGVFHIKVYIVDDELILSGANLSQEYFADRHDRYLHIVRGGNGLIDWYADLVQVLCDHSERYAGHGALQPSQKPRKRLASEVQRLLETATASDDSSSETNGVDSACTNENDIVAIACPTFQAPAFYGASYRSDTRVLVDLLRGVTGQGSTTTTTTSTRVANEESTTTDNRNSNNLRATLRLASAYLNPTQTLQQTWETIDAVHCLTAGYVSHGFRPKKKAGNKGRTWIPAVFDVLARQAQDTMRGVHVWYYTRDDWTYHAKGLWLSILADNKQEDATIAATGPPTTARFSTEETLVCVTHGSGNFGERSQFRDMESNLYLVLPPGSPLIDQHKQEWNSMCDYAISVEKTERQELEWHIRWIFPWIKRYF